jgi:hypothetical protein
MVEIVHQPPKKVIVVEYTQYSLEALSKTISAIIKTGQPFVLNWAEGVLFIRFPLMPTTKELVKEFLEGRIYWSSVMFALMPTFQSAIKSGGYEIPIIDATPNEIMREAALWLRERAEED